MFISAIPRLCYVAPKTRTQHQQGSLFQLRRFASLPKARRCKGIPDNGPADLSTLHAMQPASTECEAEPPRAYQPGAQTVFW